MTNCTVNPLAILPTSNVVSRFNVRVGMRQPLVKGLNRDNTVDLDGKLVHIDSELIVGWAGRAGVLKDEFGQAWTLRRFAPRRDHAYASVLTMESPVLAIWGFVDINGVKVEYSAMVNLKTMTAELAI